MNRSAVLCAAAVCLPLAAHGQFALRYNSTVSVGHRTEPVNGPLVEITDSISDTRGLELFAEEHTVFYTDPQLNFDPTASSRFSVDHIQQIIPSMSPTFKEFEITVSGELYRHGMGPEFPLTFEHATADLSFEIEGLPELSQTGIAAVYYYEGSASYVSDFNYDQNPFNNVAFAVYGVDGQDETLLDHVETDGTAQSATFDRFVPQAGFAYQHLRVDVHADLLNHLGIHDGETTVEFEITFKVLTNSELAADCLADTNHDGLVTPADFGAWITAFNAQAPECDQNNDSLCTPADFGAWITNFNAGCN